MFLRRKPKIFLNCYNNHVASKKQQLITIK
jgi:hypothetical protein